MRKSSVGSGTIAAGTGSDRIAIEPGGRMRPLVRFFLTVAISVIGISGFAVPAHATTWHTDHGVCGLMWEHTCAVLWTGPWPGGQVRAMGDRDVYEVALEASCGGSSFHIVASTFPQKGGSLYTPIVNPGKTCEYQAFEKYSSVGKWWYSNVGATYLGD